MSSTSTTTTSSSFRTREIQQVLLSREQAEGVGARVRRSIGRPELRNFDPFLMLDEFRVDSNKGGFPDHFHRGFETVTYMFPSSTGSFQHEDFTGTSGELGPGSLQWMTAGRGIVHSEMPKIKEGQVAHGLQLWVNLKSKDKMVEPRYQELPGEKVAKVKKDGIEAHVIAGSALGVDSPVYTLTPVHYIHFHMEPHKTLNQPIPGGRSWNSFIYTIDGRVSVGTPNKSKLIDGHNTVTLTSTTKVNNEEVDTNGVTFTTFDEPASFVFLAGEKINEPIVQHGPVVMNTKDEIIQTFRDFTEGKNGFERAPGWRSEIGRPITDHLRDDDY